MTATASPPVRDEIVTALYMVQPEVLVCGFERPGLHLSVERCPDDRTAEQRLREVVGGIEGTGLVYVDTRVRAEELAAELGTGDRAAFAYHGGLDDDSRTTVHQRFAEQEPTLVCNRCVRAGHRRAPRALRRARCGAGVARRERQERFGDAERDRAEVMRRYADDRRCRWQQVLEYFGQPVDGPCGHCDVCDAGDASGSEDGPWGADDAVEHVEFGAGEVVSGDEESVIVRFDDGTHRRLAVDVVETRSLLRSTA